MPCLSRAHSDGVARATEHHSADTIADVLHYSTTPAKAAVKEMQRQRNTRDLVHEAAGSARSARSFESELRSAMRLLWKEVRTRSLVCRAWHSLPSLHVSTATPA